MFQLLLALGFLSVIATSSVSASVVLFDNGLFSDTQELRNNACNTFNGDGTGCRIGFTVYDDFELASDSLITGIEWHQIETFPENYVTTKISLFDGIPHDATFLSSLTVIANKILTLNVPPFGSPPEFTALNSVSGLGIELLAGVYWLGVHNEWGLPNGVSSWSQTTGTVSTLPGRFQGVDSPANLPQGIEGPNGQSIQLHPNEDSVFKILGEPLAAAPEPTTLALLVIGLAGLASGKRKAVTNATTKIS